MTLVATRRAKLIEIAFRRCVCVCKALPDLLIAQPVAIEVAWEISLPQIERYEWYENWKVPFPKRWQSKQAIVCQWFFTHSNQGWKGDEKLSKLIKLGAGKCHLHSRRGALIDFWFSTSFLRSLKLTYIPLSFQMKPTNKFHWRYTKTVAAAAIKMRMAKKSHYFIS